MAKLCFNANNMYAQQFGLPYSLINQMCSNPLPNPELIYKLYSTCKYWYYSSKIIPVRSINYNNNRVNLYAFWKPEKLQLSVHTLRNQMFRWYLYDRLLIVPLQKNKSKDQYLTSTLLSQSWLCTLTYISLDFQEMTIEEYKIISILALEIHLEQTNITKLNGTPTSLEELIVYAPKMLSFWFTPPKNQIYHYYTSHVFEIIAKLMKTKPFYDLVLYELPKISNFVSIANFIKNNTAEKFRIRLYFNSEVTEIYRTPYLSSINELIDDWKKENPNRLSLSIFINYIQSS